LILGEILRDQADLAAESMNTRSWGNEISQFFNPRETGLRPVFADFLPSQSKIGLLLDQPFFATGVIVPVRIDFFFITGPLLDMIDIIAIIKIVFLLFDRLMNSFQNVSFKSIHLPSRLVMESEA
jgi:hypothetical protein